MQGHDSIDYVISLARAGDGEALASAVGRLLDDGDVPAMDAVLARQHSLPREGADLLDWAISETSQMAKVGDATARLFGIPVLVTACGCDMPTPAVREAVGLLRGLPPEPFALLDGWLHTSDLLGMHPVDFRKLAAALASAAVANDRVARLPQAAISRKTLKCGHAEGSSSVYSLESGARTVCAVFAIGAIIPSGCSGGLANLVSGGLPSGCRDILASRLAASVNGYVGMLEPGQPMEAAVDAAAFVDGITLEARLEAAEMVIGRRPITHFCLEGYALHIAMTWDGATAIDAFELQAIGIDPARVWGLLEAGSRAVVHHRTRHDMPSMADRSLN